MSCSSKPSQPHPWGSNEEPLKALYRAQRYTDPRHRQEFLELMKRIDQKANGRGAQKK